MPFPPVFAYPPPPVCPHPFGAGVQAVHKISRAWWDKEGNPQSLGGNSPPATPPSADPPLR
eukprot:gene4098-9648_t